MWYCYIIESARKTYVGCTNNPARRLRQHNGELAGGARATRAHTWRFAAVVSGLPDHVSALQFEWALKRRSRGMHGSRRAEAAVKMLIDHSACRKCGTGCQHEWDWSALRLVIRQPHNIANQYLGDDRICVTDKIVF